MAAAHIVVEQPIGAAKTAFTGTSDEDRAYLKIFWKSIHLNPTIESRLVSSDVRQRVPSLPLKSHGRSTISLTIPSQIAYGFKSRLQIPCIYQ